MDYWTWSINESQISKKKKSFKTQNNDAEIIIFIPNIYIFFLCAKHWPKILLIYFNFVPTLCDRYSHCLHCVSETQGTELALDGDSY